MAKASKTVRMAVDYGVPVAFLATWLITKNAQAATWVMVVASALALIVGWAAERRLAPLPLFAGGSALLFGTLGLVFHDPRFIQIKFTFVEGVLAVVMFGGVLLKRNPLKALLGEAIQIPDVAWRTLTIRYGLFSAACAIANEVVRNVWDYPIWIIFKFATLGGAVLFSIAQTPFLMRHGAFAEGPEIIEPPDPGF